MIKDSLRDVYQVYLWGYCVGDVDAVEDDTGNETGEGEEEEEKQVSITRCSDPEAAFAFDPVEVWGLENNVSDTAADALDEAAQKLLPEAVTEGLDIYITVSKVVFVAYIVAISTTALACLLGLLVLALSFSSSSSSSSSSSNSSASGKAATSHPSYSYSSPSYSSPAPRAPKASRFASLANIVTISVAVASFLFTLAASLTATVLFSVLVGAVNDGLEPYGITATVGMQMMIVMWLAVGFSGTAAVGWVITGCCYAKRRGGRGADGIEKGAALKHDGFEFQEERKKPGFIGKGMKGLLGRMRKDKGTSNFHVKDVRFDAVESNYDNYNHHHDDINSGIGSNFNHINDSRRLAGDGGGDVAFNDGNSSVYSMYDDHDRDATGAGAAGAGAAGVGLGTAFGARPSHGYAHHSRSGSGFDSVSGIGATASPYNYTPYEDVRNVGSVRAGSVVGRRASDDDTNALLSPTGNSYIKSAADKQDRGNGTAVALATTNSFLSGFSTRKNGEKKLKEGEGGGGFAGGYERVESPYGGAGLSNEGRGRAYSFE